MSTWATWVMEITVLEPAPLQLEKEIKCWRGSYQSTIHNTHSNVERLRDTALDTWSDDVAIGEDIVNWGRQALEIPSSFALYDAVELLCLFYEIFIVLDHQKLQAQLDALNHMKRQFQLRACQRTIQQNVIMSHLRQNQNFEPAPAPDVPAKFCGSEDEMPTGSEDEMSTSSADEDTSEPVGISSSILPGKNSRLVFEIPYPFTSVPGVQPGNPWHKIVIQWVGVLRKVYDVVFQPSDGRLSLSRGVDTTVSIALQQMCQTPSRVRQHADWAFLVKQTQLARIMTELSRPWFYGCKEELHTAKVFRVHRLGDRLGLLLNEWTPRQERTQWEQHAKARSFKPRGGQGTLIKTPDEFIEALETHQALVPRQSYPIAVYFLLSERNYAQAWHSWLGPALESHGYDVSELHSRGIQGFFADLKSNLEIRWQRGKGVVAVADPHLQVILTRSVEHTHVRELVKTHTFQNQFVQWPTRSTGQKASSSECSANKRKAEEPEPTLTPTRNQKRKEAKQQKHFSAAETPALQDNCTASPPTRETPPASKSASPLACFKCQDLPPNQRCVQDVFVRRHTDFLDSKGFLPGDGITLVPPDLQMKTTRSIHPKLVRDLRHISDEMDQLGVSGANLFSCRGYFAPIHLDIDATRGICCQLEWDGLEEWCEFSFCQAEWGYYLVTESNMLWTFNSNALHGTMSPSQESVMRLRGGSGKHVSVRRKDHRKALEYARIRDQYELRKEYWDTVPTSV
ncbi:hypothetical protein EV421DRAFT_1909192 [Armillaria borealis]|uniref:Uncharacterized protein n=1 Tax=Armillaria borealis TaxID=47425 RepID=A0AA39MII2_9AGAR|nr:hypothetical protein EV421DRAFT_1909192 [Armillaria borealis]